MKTHLSYLAIIFALLATATYGRASFLSMQVVGRGDVREASYLASDFTRFVIQHDRLPTSDEASGFLSRLSLAEVRGKQYVYKCGLKNCDTLVIERDDSGDLQFIVGGPAPALRP